jgi:hypothetical protein
MEENMTYAELENHILLADRMIAAMFILTLVGIGMDARG